MDVARASYAAGDLPLSFRHLERAHILGQRAVWPHVVTHWWMLKVGFRLSDAREIRGQLARIMAAVLGSVLGWVPLGNTGGANVSPIKPMPVPAEFTHYFEGYDPKRQQRRRLMIIAAFLFCCSASAPLATAYGPAPARARKSPAAFPGNATKSWARRARRKS
jgi:hypothetical protein